MKYVLKKKKALVAVIYLYNIGRFERIFSKEKNYGLPVLLYAHKPSIMQWIWKGLFPKIFKRRDLKLNTHKNKVILLEREEWLVCDASVDDRQNFPGLRYLGFVLDELARDGVESCKKKYEERVLWVQ